MQIIDNIQAMQTFADNIRTQRKTICFVPTMGFLHKGHISLLNEGRKQGDILVLSIFVNPTQFAQGEDFETYPRNLHNDLKLAEEADVDVVFTPNAKDLYKKHYQTYVSLEQLPNHLCGISRPDHFKGVATIVTKLFNIVKPHKAFFGQKDFQQLAVIERMTMDLNLNIEIIGCPIVRESDGLAMSSRNTYLSEEQRQTALCLYNSLKDVEMKVLSGILNVSKLKNETIKYISSFPDTKIDYVSICDPITLENIKSIQGPFLIALAVFVGNTRLIDNMIIIP